MIGANHVMTFVTGVMMFCDWSKSSSAFSLLQYMNQIVCAMCAQDGWVFTFYRDMKFFPLIWPSKALGYKLIVLLFRYADPTDNIYVYYFGYY